MKLAVMKMPGHIPGGGFHYCLVPKRLESDSEAAIWQLMGHTVIEVSAEVGERLLASAVAALNHQVEVAYLTEKALASQ